MGSILQSVDNIIRDLLTNITKSVVHIIVAETYYFQTILLKDHSPFPVIRQPLLRNMLISIDFNHQQGLGTEKVRNKTTNGFLSLKPDWISG